MYLTTPQKNESMIPEFFLLSNEIEKRRINVRSVLYIKTDDYLSTFYLTNKQKFTCSKPLTEIAAFFPDHFFQINRAIIVNLNEISSIKRNSRKIILNDATELIVAFRRSKALHDAFAAQSMTFAR